MLLFEKRKISKINRTLVTLLSWLIDNPVSCFFFFFLQTILIQNIYRNPQNSAQTADASRCEYKQFFTSSHANKQQPCNVSVAVVPKN